MISPSLLQIKAALFISMLLLAEARKAQENIRLKKHAAVAVEDVKTNPGLQLEAKRTANVVEKMMGEAHSCKHRAQFNEPLELIMNSPCFRFREPVKRFAKVFRESLISSQEQIKPLGATTADRGTRGSSNHDSRLHNQTDHIAEQVRVMMDVQEVKTLTKHVEEHMEAITKLAPFETHAKHICDHLKAVLAIVSVTQYVESITEQINEFLAYSNLQQQLKRLGDHANGFESGTSSVVFSKDDLWHLVGNIGAKAIDTSVGWDHMSTGKLFDNSSNFLFVRMGNAPSLHHLDLDKVILGKPGLLADVEERRVPQAAIVTKSVDRFIDETYGSGLYQLRVWLLAGALFASSSPLTQLCVFIMDKMVDDPTIPQFNRKSLSLCQTLTFVGWGLGTLAWAPAFDRFGRRKITYALAFVSVLGFACTAAASEEAALYTYAISNFVAGFTLPFFQGAYTLAQEISPSNRRAAVNTGVNVAYSVFLALMALVCGTVTRHLNWHIETLIWAAYMMILTVVGYPVLDESLRFLHAKGRAAEVAAVAKSVVKLNGVDGIGLQTSETFATEKNAVAKTSHLLERKYILRLLACAVNWVTTSVCYYGLTFAAGSLSANKYLNVALFALVDMIGYFVPAPILSVLGRVSAQRIALLVAAAFLLLSGFMPHGSWILIVCVLIGRISLDVAFATIYLITAEIFPTDCRSTAFGISSSVARFLSLLAPGMSQLPIHVSCTVFASLCAFAAVITSTLPETKGQKMDAEESAPDVPTDPTHDAREVPPVLL